MNKWILFLVVSSLCLSLVACGDEGNGAATTAPVPDSSIAQPGTIDDTVSSPSTEPEEELATGSASSMQPLLPGGETKPGAPHQGSTPMPMPPDDGMIPGDDHVVPPTPPEGEPGQPGELRPLPPVTTPADPNPSGGLHPLPPDNEIDPPDPGMDIPPVPPVIAPDGSGQEPPSAPPTESRPMDQGADDIPPLPPSSGTTASPPQTAPPEATICNHQYDNGYSQAATCLQAGFQNQTCSKCGSSNQILSPALGHRFSAGRCSRCGAADPNPRTVTILVKDSENNRIPGVSVDIFTNGDAPASSGVTDNQGRVSLTIGFWWESYQVTLPHIPDGYRASKDLYRFTADNGNIVLESVPLIDTTDHSRAAYRIGDQMGDFTVTDTDGKTHQLSGLLQEKELVILNFWYCSCVPCKAEFPYFEAVYQHYGERIEILAMNHIDPDLQEIRQVKATMGLSFPFVQEALGMDGGFDIRSYPVTVFIGKNGTILNIQKDVGFQSEAELLEMVAQMLPIE